MDSCIAKFRGHKSQVISLAIDAPSNASWLASGSECGQVRIFDLQTQRSIRGMKLPQSIGSIISHKGSSQLHVASGPSIYAFDLRSPKDLILATPSPSFESSTDEINQIALHDNGMFMASVDDSGQVNVMDVRTGAPFKRFRRKHDNLATCVAFRPHKPWELFTGSFDQSVIAWDFSRGSPNRDFTPALNAEVKSLNPPFVYCLQVSSDGKTCFIGKGDGTLQVLQSKGKKCKKEDWFVTDHEAHRWSLTSLSIDDQGLIATGSLDGGLGLWKLEENGQVKSRQKIEMGNYKVNALQRISNSAHQIAVAGYDATGQSTGDILIYSFQQ